MRGSAGVGRSSSVVVSLSRNKRSTLRLLLVHGEGGSLSPQQSGKVLVLEPRSIAMLQVLVYQTWMDGHATEVPWPTR